MFVQRLGALRTLADLAPLFQALGYEPDDRPHGDGLTGVARWKSFRVVALESPTPREAARAGARRLAGAAAPGLVAALGNGLLALAAPRLGAVGASPVLGVAVRAPDPRGLELLERLRPRADTTALAHALRVAEVLATEEIGGRFFTAFHAVLERMIAACGARGDTADRSLAALLALTRVLFLYFVQVKGWLDGRADFLRAQLDAALAGRRHFHRTVLHPLFFGTLNRPVSARTHGARFGNIPYLNGGLFEPHPVERRLGPLIFPNALWRDAFDDLFERFRFCVREGDDADAVAPDMLGRVFERVMNPVDRQASGTFYTPERLVRRLVHYALSGALAAEGLAPEIAAAVLAGTAPPRHDDEIRRALGAVRVLDPAVGSGAFLLGTLEALTAAWRAIPGAADGPVLRRRILRDNLFGVDLSPVAVQLAELRLWLAVVSDDPTTDVARVRPLPNLNGVLRQGDSLLDPVGAAQALGLLRERPSGISALRIARDRLFDARGAARGPATAALREAELSLGRRLVEAAIARARRALADLEAAAGSPDLFGRRSGLARDQRERARRLTAQLAELEAAERRTADGIVPFFSYEVHRPDVITAGGFSAVVGNPPWVRAERLPASLRAALTARFTWWLTTTGRGGYGNQPDLAVAFLERCVELTKPGGTVAVLVPAKLTSSGYGEPARAALVRETTIDLIHRVSDPDAFDAAVYPLALAVRRTRPPADAVVSLDPDGAASVPQRALASPGPWVLVDDRARHALAAFRRSGVALRDVAPPALGVKTGADRLLVGRVERVEEGVATVRFGNALARLERAMLRPALRGRELRPFRAAPSGVLLWAHDTAGAPLARLPPRAARYVARHRSALEARGDRRDEPAWAVFRVRAAVAPWRVAWSDIARRPAAVLLAGGADAVIPLNTCYVAPAPDREVGLAITAVVNSIWAQASVRVTADEARGGYRRHNARVMGDLPIPLAGARRSTLAEVSRLAHSSDVPQRHLDAAVADALGLSLDVRDALASLAGHSR